jgi:hypothetical protein
MNTPAPAPSDARAWRLITWVTLASLALSVLMFAPRLWLMRGYLPGTFQWDRAHTFLLQCELPFRRDIEAAMLWRLLPPLVCHFLGLHGWTALALPWIGIVSMTAFVARVLARRSAEARVVFGGTVLFTTTSAVLVPVGWLGINDAWAWLGLLAVAFAESWWARLLACLLCPWIDERFLIGLPLAWAVRLTDSPARNGIGSLLPLLGLVPYVALRLLLSSDPQIAGPTREFLAHHFQQAIILLPWAPLAWWMGLRAAWLPAVNAIRLRPVLLGGGAALTLVVCMLLAADMSRSAAILVPLVLLGVCKFADAQPQLAPRIILAAGIANLLIPAAHISFTKFDPIHNLAIELFRLWRGN